MIAFTVKNLSYGINIKVKKLLVTLANFGQVILPIL